MEKEILTKLYDTTRDLAPSAEYNRKSEEFVKARDLFLQDIATQNSNTLENLTDSQNSMNDELNKQAFCEGFSMAVRLFVESTYKEGDDQE